MKNQFVLPLILSQKYTQVLYTYSHKHYTRTHMDARIRIFAHIKTVPHKQKYMTQKCCLRTHNMLLSQRARWCGGERSRNWKS